MDLSRIMAALSQRQGQAPARAGHPHARLARAMAGRTPMHAPGPTERAQHESSGYAHNYNGVPDERQPLQEVMR
jgi:hypothetical protein